MVAAHRVAGEYAWCALFVIVFAEGCHKELPVPVDLFLAGLG